MELMLQVLVHSPSSNLERTRACLEAAHAMSVPERCSRTIYLLDTAQCAPQPPQAPKGCHHIHAGQMIALHSSSQHTALR